MLIMDYDDAIKKVVEMEKNGYYHQAIELLNQILEKKPDDYTATLLIAQNLLQYGWFKQSFINCEKVLKKNSQDPIVWGMMGELFRILDLNHYAKQCYNEAIKNNHPESKRISDVEKNLEEKVQEKITKLVPSDDGNHGFRELDHGENLNFEMTSKINEFANKEFEKNNLSFANNIFRGLAVYDNDINGFQGMIRVLIKKKEFEEALHRIEEIKKQYHPDWPNYEIYKNMVKAETED